MSESDSTPTDAEGAETPQHTKEELKYAYKAFKKRLKLHQLDDESKLGGGATSSGGSSGIVGVRPPEQFPQSIWDQLVEKGRMKYMGNGLYGRGDT